MKKNSPFQIILMVVFGALGIAGIMFFALFVGTGNTNTVGTVTIWGTFDAQTMTSIIQQAADTNTDLTQVSYVQKDPTTYESDITNALASGKGPTLIIMRQDYAITDASKIATIGTASISQSQFNANYIMAAAPFFGQSGAVGIPFLADPLVLYWNRDMFSSAGISEPPKYWEDVYSMAPKLTQRDDAGNIVKSAIALGEYANIGDAKDVLALLFMQAGNTITSYDATGRLNSTLAQKAAGAVQPAVSALNFYTEFADPSKSDYSWNRSMPDARTAFATGDVAMYIGYASEAALIRKINPNAVFSVAPVPQLKDATRSIDTGTVYAFAAPRTTTNAAGGLKAANELASLANSQVFATALGMASARNDALAVPAQNTADTVNKAAIMMRSWFDPNPLSTSATFRGMIEDTSSGAVTTLEAVQRADQELSHIIGL